MKKLFPILAAATLLTACEDLKFGGQLTVHSNFNINEDYDPVACNERFDWWNCRSKSLSVDSGSHTAEISLTKLGTTKQIFLKLDGKRDKEIKIELNKDIKLNDQFYIQASDIKQDFDISGRIDTQVSDSQEISGVETCSETHYERRCRWVQQQQDVHQIDMQPNDGGHLVPGPSGGHQGGGHHGGDLRPVRPLPPREICENVPVTLYGDQDVSFFYRTTVKTLSAQFVKSQNSLADFVGTKSSSDKIYTYRSVCRLNGRPRF